MKKIKLIPLLLISILLVSCTTQKKSSKKKSSSSSGQEETSITSTEQSTTSSSSNISSNSNSKSSSSSEESPEEEVISISAPKTSLDVYSDPQVQCNFTLGKLYQSYTVNWRTTNSSIISITQQGLVTAVGVEEGKSVSVESVYAFITVGDTQITSNYISMSVTDSTPVPSIVNYVEFQTDDKYPFIDVNEEKTYTIKVMGSDGSDKYSRKVNLEIDHPEVCSFELIEKDVDVWDQVKIKGLKGGSAVLTATSKQDSSKFDKLYIEVDPAITGLVEIKSHPDKVVKGGTINEKDVVIVASLDNGETKDIYADIVNCDTSNVGPTTATAVVYGVGSLTFEITVFDGVNTTFLFTDKNWSDSTSSFEPYNSIYGAGNSFENNRGVQTTGSNQSGFVSKATFIKISSISIKFASSTNGKGTVRIYLGEEQIHMFGIQENTTLQDETKQLSPLTDNKIRVTINCSDSSVYIKSITVIQEN